MGVFIPVIATESDYKEGMFVELKVTPVDVWLITEAAGPFFRLQSQEHLDLFLWTNEETLRENYRLKFVFAGMA